MASPCRWMTRCWRSVISGRAACVIRRFRDRPNDGLSAGGVKDPLHLTFGGSKAGPTCLATADPTAFITMSAAICGRGCCGLGGIVEIDPHGLIIGSVPILNGDAATTTSRSAVPITRSFTSKGRPAARVLALHAPYPGLIGPGGDAARRRSIEPRGNGGALDLLRVRNGRCPCFVWTVAAVT